MSAGSLAIACAELRHGAWRLFCAERADGAVLRIHFKDTQMRAGEREQFQRELTDAHPDASTVAWASGEPSQVGTQLVEYLEGQRQAFELDLAPGGTPFQEQVWHTLRTRVPYGETCSYGRLARMIERPRAVRAVARANSQNPIPIVIPCHRVIGSDGTLTGYAGGLAIKRALLDHEAARAGAQPNLPFM